MAHQRVIFCKIKNSYTSDDWSIYKVLFLRVPNSTVYNSAYIALDKCTQHHTIYLTANKYKFYQNGVKIYLFK